jgi:hypothetical protein
MINLIANDKKIHGKNYSLSQWLKKIIGRKIITVTIINKIQEKNLSLLRVSIFSLQRL